GEHPWLGFVAMAGFEMARGRGRGIRRGHSRSAKAQTREIPQESHDGRPVVDADAPQLEQRRRPIVRSPAKDGAGAISRVLRCATNARTLLAPRVRQNRLAPSSDVLENSLGLAQLPGESRFIERRKMRMRDRMRANLEAEIGKCTDLVGIEERLLDLVGVPHVRGAEEPGDDEKSRGEAM